MNDKLSDDYKTRGDEIEPKFDQNLSSTMMLEIFPVIENVIWHQNDV